MEIYDARPSSYWCDQEVVGESFYTDTLMQIVNVVPVESGNDRRFDAALVLEKDNPHSRAGHAISVRWRGKVIGYIPDSETDRYYPEIARLAASGYDIGVRVRLWVSEYDDEYTSINVGVQPPGKIIPLNDPPTEGWALIPGKTSMQVTKEKDHFDVLQDYLPPQGKAYLLATLHPIACGTRTTWTGLEVRLDGERVGELSKVSSAKLLPIVEHYENMGLTTVCRAYLRGSSVAAELTLDITPAHEVTDESLDNPPISPIPRLVAYQDDPDDYSVPDRYIPYHPDEIRAAETEKRAKVTVTTSPSPAPSDSQKVIVTVTEDEDEDGGQELLDEYHRMIYTPPPTSETPNTPVPAATAVPVPQPKRPAPAWLVYPAAGIGSFILNFIAGFIILIPFSTFLGSEGQAFDIYMSLFVLTWLITPAITLFKVRAYRRKQYQQLPPPF